MSGLAARTENLRIGSLVLCNSFRNPALLAKSLTTIDHVSNGRLEIGLGAGWMEEEYRGYGYDFPVDGHPLAPARRGLADDEAAVHRKARELQGPLLSLDERLQYPKPVQSPHPPITIGGSGEKVMLKIVAKHADRWNCPAGYKNFKHKLSVLKEHCKPWDVTSNRSTSPSSFWYVSAPTRPRSRTNGKSPRACSPSRSPGSRARPPRSSISYAIASKGHHLFHRDLWRFRSAADYRIVRARGDAGVRLTVVEDSLCLVDYSTARNSRPPPRRAVSRMRAFPR